MQPRPLGLLLLLSACAPASDDTASFTRADARADARARVAYAATDPLDLTLTGTGPGEAFGAALAFLGDIDGDGTSDLGVGAPDTNAQAGRFVVYTAAELTGGDTTGTLFDGGETGAGLGSALSTAGDVNGDGYDDAVVAAPDAGGTGAVYLYLGGATGLSASPAQTLSVGSDPDGFGASVAGGCDVDGDGTPDLLVGAPRYGSRAGRAYLFLGTGNGYATTPSLTLDGATAGSELGASVACAGDLDDDGIDDLAVGAPGLEARGPGYVDVHLGATGGPSATPTTTLRRGGAVDAFGYAVAPAGDVDGDGVDDLLVGAPLRAEDDGSSVTGWAGVFLGGPGGLTSTPIREIRGSSDSPWTGAAVAGAGEVASDGGAGIVVGSPAEGGSVGAARVYDGPVGLGTTPDPPYDFVGDAEGQRVGFAVAGAGDLDGDGHPEVVFGAPAVGSGQGEVTVWETSQWGLDEDRDGWTFPEDCDDTNGGVNPGMHDVTCDGIDTDCDGAVDQDAVTSRDLYYDRDGDGFGQPADFPHWGRSCSGEYPGFVGRPGDCDDGNAAVNPDAVELCDGIDNDCSRAIDDGPRGEHPDADGDGFGDGSRPADICSATSTVWNERDCDDTDPTVYRGAVEVCDGVDQDCDGRIDEGFVYYYADGDGDGQGAGEARCTAAGGDVTNDRDCDDADATIHRGAEEVCDGIDQDCDGDGDHIAGAWRDVDNDGFGDPGSPADACIPAPTVDNHLDCDDARPSAYPFADEVCDGLDNNCNGAVDESGDRSGWYPDEDGDGYGAPGPMVGECTRAQPRGTTTRAGDCDDADATVHPGAEDPARDGVDSDCDGFGGGYPGDTGM